MRLLIAGLIAARLAGIKKRVYTRHNSTINLDYYPNAVKYDKLVNYLATDIIAISKVVKDVLMKREGVKEDKIKIVYHGFDFEEMDGLAAEHRSEIENKYAFSNGRYPVVGVVSRFIHYKGIQHIIPAFDLLLKNHPDAHLVLCNAAGPYSNEINSLLKRLPADKYTLVEFEKNIFSLYKTFDVFVHVPVYAESEAFGQSCIEAWALGVPAIYTNAGIIKEVGRDNYNCIMVDFENEDVIFKGLPKITHDKEFQKKLIANGRDTARNGEFNISKMIEGLTRIYTA